MIFPSRTQTSTNICLCSLLDFNGMKYLFLLLAFVCFFHSQAQSPINTASLPVYSNEERDNIQNVRDGMMIYNSTTHCINYYGYGLWRALCGQCASPPPQPTVMEVKSFYNSVTIRLKPDVYQHQFALMPSFTLLPDTSSKKVILRDGNMTFDQVMLLNVSDCGSSQPIVLEEVKFLEKNPCGNDPILTDIRDGNEYRDAGRRKRQTAARIWALSWETLTRSIPRQTPMWFSFTT